MTPLPPEVLEGLFSRCGKGTRTVLSGVPGFHLGIILEYHDHPMPVSPPLLDVLGKVRRSTCGRWINMNGQLVHPDEPFQVSVKMRISCAFEYSHPAFKEWSKHLTFIYIIQGAYDLGRCKITATNSIASAAAGMLQDAMNGFSITFSGAVHRESFDAVLDLDAPDWSCKFVQNVTWQEATEDGKTTIIKKDVEGAEESGDGENEDTQTVIRVNVFS